MDFSPDGKVLATGEDDGVVRLWNAASGDELLTLRSEPGAVRQLRFSPDGGVLAAGVELPDRRAEVWLWHAATGDAAFEGSGVPVAPSRIVPADRFAWIQNSRPVEPCSKCSSPFELHMSRLRRPLGASLALPARERAGTAAPTEPITRP